MIRFTAFSFRSRLTLLLLLALAPETILVLRTASQQRRLARAEVRASSTRMLMDLATQSDQLVDSSRRFLMVIARLPAVRSMDHTGCDALFAQFLPKYPLYNNIGLIGMDGYSVASALPVRGRLYLGDRTYFRRAVKNRDFAVGDYQVGRITRKPGINAGLPVFDDKGVVVGVVYVTLSIAWLNDYVKTAQLPAGSTFTVTDRAGTVLVRYPFPKPWVGRSLAHTDVGRKVLEEKSGMWEGPDEEGMPRLFVYSPLQEPGGSVVGYVAIGIPRYVAYGEADLARARNLIGLAFIAVLTILVVWVGSDALFLQQVHALAKAVKRLSAGDLSARTGLPHKGDELSRLATAFDDMAASLESARDRLLEAENEKKRIYSEVIRCVTLDKFHLVDADEIPAEGRLLLEMPVETPDDYKEVRGRLRAIADEHGLDQERRRELVQAAGEAVTNALKHAKSGTCRIWATEDRLIVRVSDQGPGIRAEDLAATILMPGFSSKVSLGMGYSLMLMLSDRLWLSTGPEGTVVQLEKYFQPRAPMKPILDAALDRLAAAGADGG